MLRRTAVDLLADPGWDPADGARARAEELAPVLQAEVDQAVAELEAVDDPVERARVADEQAQVAALVYAAAVDARDDAIRQVYAQAPPRAGALNRRLSELLLLSEGQLRLIRVKDRVGSKPGSGRGGGFRDDADLSLLTEDRLRQAYVVEGRSAVDIAREARVSRHTVRAYLDRYGIETRQGRARGTSGS